MKQRFCGQLSMLWESLVAIGANLEGRIAKIEALTKNIDYCCKIRQNTGIFEYFCDYKIMEYFLVFVIIQFIIRIRMGLSENIPMDILNAFTPNQFPSIFTLYTFTITNFFKGCRDLLLLYPINIILFIIGLYCIFLKLSNKILKKQAKKSIKYWPNPHIERYDNHLKNLRKDLRDLKSEAFNMQRKVQKGNAEQEENGEEDSMMFSDFEREEIRSLVEQRDQISAISDELHQQISTSTNTIIKQLQKLKKNKQ